MVSNTGFVSNLGIIHKTSVILGNLQSISDEELLKEQEFVNQTYGYLADIAARSWTNNLIPDKLYERLLDTIGRLGLIIKQIENDKNRHTEQAR